jgi:flagellar hook protein FlgE
LDHQSARGKIRISGNVGTANELRNLTLAKAGGDRLTVWTEIHEAEGESVIANATFYDSIGAAHTVEITYVLESKDNLDPDRGVTWRWFAECVDNTPADSAERANRCVGTGWIRFRTDGQYSTENPQAAISIELANRGVSTPLIVSVSHEDVTGFANEVSEIALVDQDGYRQGTLEDFSVSADGIVVGVFSNGQTRHIAQIALARFPNNNGLLARGRSLFSVGPNSGIPIVGAPGTFARGTIRGGFLEESNVDMAKQFTDLIVSQRAFQANARTITVANEMLQDLVNIV